jgi:hypothetical protein
MTVTHGSFQRSRASANATSRSRNSQWGRKMILVPPPVATEWEQRQHLPADELKAWALRNYRSRYIPEEYLKSIGVTVESDIDL